MESKRSSKLPRAVLAGVLWLAATAPLTAQNSFEVLHSFGGPGDGVGPSSGAIFDRRGNAYGETLGGGSMACAYGCGLVYELSPQEGGAWAETILYEFTGGTDGYEPNGGLAIDGAGNLYGVTRSGGANGYGAAFELTPGASGWREATLYSFCTPPACTDGFEPRSAPVLDPADNLYGTAGNVAYELSPGPSGWTETVLYTFCSQPNCTDGGDPQALVRDAAGNLYGATYDGGSSNDGVIFALRPQPGGQWQYQVLYSFQGSDDGEHPNAATLHNGALFGSTNNGGGSKLCTTGCGTVFELAAGKAGGPPVETVLHRFGPPSQGILPLGPVAFVSAGDAFGVAGDGGGPCGCGAVFEISAGGRGKPPVYRVAHDFDGQDGALPLYVSTHGGNVFGTTLGGGQYGVGVVFEISAPPDAVK